MTNLGALGIVALLGTPEHEHDELRDFAGLWRSRPALAGVMTIFLLSLGGFPPTAGFIGKWYIFPPRWRPVTTGWPSSAC